METPPLDLVGSSVRLAATLFFVAANGFFVAAEFALVKVRASQLRERAQRNSRARLAYHIRTHLDLYLSACQLGITLSSLILGWLAEPAVAELLVWVAAASGLPVDPHGFWLHAISLALALSIVTFLHMTLGEQVPKIWSINRADSVVLQTARLLQLFANVFRPFIWIINESSNGLLRLAGMPADELGEGTATVEELRGILAASAEEGHISDRQLQLAQNVFAMIELEVRHILVPRVDVDFLSIAKTLEENLQIVRETGHSRFPLCEGGLDTVVGVLHAKELLSAIAGNEPVELTEIARHPLFVPDTQPIARLIAQMQRTRVHCAVVLDEHGTAVGLAFLEDAIEEIVGPIGDEFDPREHGIVDTGEGVLELPGTLSLPEAGELLKVEDFGEEADTIGGYVVATLGRLPRPGDELLVGAYRVTVHTVERRRIVRLRAQPVHGQARPVLDAPLPEPSEG